MRSDWLKRLATATVFFGYLLVQGVYPALSWFDARFRWFAWNMYTGRPEPPRFAVIYEDGSSEMLPSLTQRSAPARLYSGSVHQARFVPPYLCERWRNVRAVRLMYRFSGRERMHECPSRTR